MPAERTPDVGAVLREARERRGVSLRQIAEATKISVPALDALERNDLSHLPGGIFTRAFVRAYAREVGLDVEQTVRQFVEQFPGEDPSVTERPSRAASPDHRLANRDGRLMRLATRVLTVVLFVAVVVAYLAWSGRLASWRQAAVGVPAAGETVVAHPQPTPPETPAAAATAPGEGAPVPAPLVSVESVVVPPAASPGVTAPGRRRPLRPPPWTAGPGARLRRFRKGCCGLVWLHREHAGFR